MLCKNKNINDQIRETLYTVNIVQCIEHYKFIKFLHRML